MVVGTLFFGAKRSNQWMQYSVDTVRSGIVVYGGWDSVFDTKKVKPVDAVRSGMQWYMVVGTLSLVQKGQTSGCSGCST